MRFLARNRLSRRMRARLEEHERHAEPLLAQLREDAGGGRESVALMLGGRRVAYLEQGDVDRLPSMRLLDEEEDARKLSVAIACATAASSSFTLEAGVVRKLLRERLPWSGEDAELLLQHALAAERDWFVLDRLAWAAKAAEDFVAGGGDPDVLRRRLERASDLVERTEAGSGAERKTLRKRLRTLLSMSARAPTALDLKLVGKDAWGNRVRALVSEHWREDQGVGALLLHLGDATKGPRPTHAWERRRDELLAPTPDGERVVRMLLESALATEDSTREVVYGGERYLYATWVTEPSEVLLRGAIWAAAPFEWAPELLGRIAEHAAAPAAKSGDPRSLVVANAAARSLRSKTLREGSCGRRRRRSARSTRPRCAGCAASARSSRRRSRRSVAASSRCWPRTRAGASRTGSSTTSVTASCRRSPSR